MVTTQQLNNIQILQINKINGKFSNIEEQRRVFSELADGDYICMIYRPELQFECPIQRSWFVNTALPSIKCGLIENGNMLSNSQLYVYIIHALGIEDTYITKSKFYLFMEQILFFSEEELNIKIAMPQEKL